MDLVLGVGRFPCEFRDELQHGASSGAVPQGAWCTAGGINPAGQATPELGREVQVVRVQWEGCQRPRSCVFWAFFQDTEGVRFRVLQHRPLDLALADVAGTGPSTKQGLDRVGDAIDVRQLGPVEVQM